MKNKILVASWGYSMILTTWVKVVEESPKSLLVYEIHSKGLTESELREKNLKPGYLQSYSVADDQPKGRNGQPVIPFRLYKRGTEAEPWTGKPSGMSTKLYFKEWDGKPVFEDHCD